jgi:hypothetical protein
MLEAPITRRPVDSTHLASVGYVPETSILEVEFRNGSIYPYFMVPESTVERLLAADSVGAFFNREIRPRHRFTRQG